MSTESIPTRKPRQTIVQAWLNLIRSVVAVDIVPRATGGGPLANAGPLGSSTYKYKRAYVFVGYFGPGDIEFMYDYNGTLTVPEGWMLCDGRQITESNYNTEHGSGKWATYIGSSPLNNKYLPNLNNKFLQYGSNTQDGSSALTFVNNAGHIKNATHNHGTKNTSVFSTSNTVGGWTSPGSLYFQGLATDPVTHSHGYTANNATLNVSIKPESIACRAYMRII